MRLLPPRRRVAAWLAVVAALAPTAAAHDGPPYPILVDEVVADWTISVWADPDVGTGTFYYYVDPPPGRRASELTIEAHAFSALDPGAPVAGLSETAEPDEPFQLIGTLEFAHRGTWPTRFVLRAGDEPVLGELAFDLDVTPPGLGTIDILWFALPFLAVAALWLRIFFAQRTHERALSASPEIES